MPYEVEQREVFRALESLDADGGPRRAVTLRMVKTHGASRVPPA